MCTHAHIDKENREWGKKICSMFRLFIYFLFCLVPFVDFLFSVFLFFLSFGKRSSLGLFLEMLPVSWVNSKHFCVHVGRDQKVAVDPTVAWTDEGQKSFQEWVRRRSIGCQSKAPQTSFSNAAHRTETPSLMSGWLAGLLAGCLVSHFPSKKFKLSIASCLIGCGMRKGMCFLGTINILTSVAVPTFKIPKIYRCEHLTLFAGSFSETC